MLPRNQLFLLLAALAACSAPPSQQPLELAAETAAEVAGSPDGRVPDQPLAADLATAEGRWQEPPPSVLLAVGAARRMINPTFESYTDLNGNGHFDAGEPFEDDNQNGQLDTLEMGGFGWRHPTGIHDDLWARAMAMRVHGEWFVVVAVDALGLGAHRITAIQDRLLELLESPPHLPRERVIVASTHSHAVPDCIGIFGEAGADQSYLAMVEQMAAEAAEEAVKAVAPAELLVASAQAPELVRDIDPPEISDPLVAIIQARTPGGQAIVTMLSIANHPETTWSGNTLFSADYPYYLLQALEAEYGGMGLYVSGALGLMQSPAKLGEAGFERAELVGNAYADHVRTALAAAAPVPAEQLPPVFGFALATAALENLELYVGIKDGQVDGYQDLLYLTGEPPCDFFGCLDVPLSVVRLGQHLTIVAIPGELTPELVVGGIVSPPGYGGPYAEAPAEPILEDHLATPHRFIIGLAGMEVGYIYPKMTHEPKEHFSQNHSPGPNLAMALMTALTGLLDEVNQK